MAIADLNLSSNDTSCETVMCVVPMRSSRYMRYPACFGGKPMNIPRIVDRWVCCFLGMRRPWDVGACRRKPTGHPKTRMWPILGLRPKAL